MIFFTYLGIYVSYSVWFKDFSQPGDFLSKYLAQH